jgi:hypothetical protein
MSDPSSQSPQSLTDERLARIKARSEAFRSAGMGHGTNAAYDSAADVPRLLAEVFRLRAENTALASKLADAEAGLEKAREEHGGTCYEMVFWWDGEYEGECELAKYHGGPHFDGLSWWDDDRNEVEAPAALGLDQDGRGSDV